MLKPEIRSRLADSVETALKLSQGLAIVTIASNEHPSGWVDQIYSEKFACPVHPNVSLPELEPRLFSFNSPHGACPTCHGLGTKFEFDPDLIVPDDSLSLENGAIEAWRKSGKRFNIWYSRILRTFARDFSIDYHAPFKDMPKKTRDILMFGTEARGSAGTGTEFEGVIPNLQRRFETTESEWVKTKMHGYMSEQPCDRCAGKRLMIAALSVRLHTHDMHIGSSECTAPAEVVEEPVVEVATKKSKGKKRVDIATPTAVILPGYNIDDVTRMTVEKAKAFFENLELSREGAVIAEPIICEINSRLGFMFDVGLGYLTLDRKTGSLSGGEAQRIRLATQVGSGLVGVCYVLDEPTIGLHQRDTRGSSARCVGCRRSATPSSSSSTMKTASSRPTT